MEASYSRIFDNHISKKTSNTWSDIVDVFGGQEHLKSKIGLKYVLASNDSATFFFQNDLSRPSRVEITRTEEDRYRVIFRRYESYICFVYSIFHNVKEDSLISLFEKETCLKVSVQ